MISLQQILTDKWVSLLEKEHSSLLLPDLQKSLTILKSHVKQSHSIWILWDFDTDWITATSSFVLWLRDLFPTLKVLYRVPERSEWHWVNKRSIDFMNSSGVKLIFTCDNGSNDVEQIAYANSLGIDVIVTDHHQITVENYTYCLINCERSDSTYPYKHLCWCGVVYKFLQAIEESWLSRQKIQETTRLIIQRLVTIATIVDMVHLDDENLYFVHNFRKLFNSTTDSSFFTLLTELTDYNSESGKWFWWSVWPLFNGAWRLERANGLIQLIVEQTKIKNLGEVLQYYVNLNSYRKELTKWWNKYLKEKVIRSKHVNIIRDLKIPPGLKRLIANEYLEWKVAFCGAPNPEDETVIDCSVSNSYWVNLLDFLSSQKYTVNVGGHYGAFWFSYYLKDEQEFLDTLNAYIDSLDVTQHILSHDYELQSADITLSFIKEVSSFVWWTWLEEPIFRVSATCKSWKILAEKHMKVSLELEDGRVIDMIKWNETKYDQYLGVKQNYNIRVDINRYMWKETIQFFLQ